MTFSYFGGKEALLDEYPRPLHDLIIEPFCGSARYSCRYGLSRNVWINDAKPQIWNIWRWIQSATMRDIDKLPSLTRPGESLADHKYLSHVERDLLGYATGANRASPSDKVTPWAAKKGGTAKLKQDLRRLCGRVSHWKITCLDYTEIPNQEACWFCDPPYEHHGKYYALNKIDFKRLGKWCLERAGQLIVCESSKAKWLPFVPLKKHIKRTNRKDNYTEAIYYRSGCKGNTFAANDSKVLSNMACR